MAEAALRRGSAAARQRRAFHDRHELGDVVDLVLAETRGAVEPVAPGDTGLSLDDYTPKGFDEAVTDEGQVRGSHRALLEAVTRLDAATLRNREAACAVDAQSRGGTFRPADRRRRLRQRGRRRQGDLRDTYRS